MNNAAGVEIVTHLHTSEKLIQEILDMSVTERLTGPDDLVQIGWTEISFGRKRKQKGH